VCVCVCTLLGEWDLWTFSDKDLVVN
jgi:hypothetical protein